MGFLRDIVILIVLGPIALIMLGIPAVSIMPTFSWTRIVAFVGVAALVTLGVVMVKLETCEDN